MITDSQWRDKPSKGKHNGKSNNKRSKSKKKS